MSTETEKVEREFATRDQEKRLLAMLVQYFPEGKLPLKQTQDLIGQNDGSRLVEAFLKMVREHQILPPPDTSYLDRFPYRGW